MSKVKQHVVTTSATTYCIWHKPEYEGELGVVGWCDGAG